MRFRPLLIVFAAMWLLACPHAPAQQLQLMISPTPSPYLSDWEKRKETVTLRITNPGAQRSAKLSAKVSLDGVLKAATNKDQMVPFLIPSGITVLDASQVLPVTSVEFYGDAKQTATRSGMLPAGHYELCVALLDPATGTPLTPPVCGSFRMVAYQAPHCLQPMDGAALRTLQGQVFRWTPVTPPMPVPVRYVLSVFEVLQGQTPMQAFRANQPIVSEEVDGRTQMFWPTGAIAPDGGGLIWSVQALDAAGHPIGELDGRAEPFTFSVEKGASGLVFANNACNDAAAEVQRAKDELQKLKDELAASGKKVADAKKAADDCLDALAAAKAARDAANAALKRQTMMNAGITKNTGPGKTWPDKAAAEKDHGDYEKALKDAQAAADAAEAKRKELEALCPGLTEALKAERKRDATLPYDIERAKKALAAAETALTECEKKAARCPEGEYRDAPGKSATSTDFLCATAATSTSLSITYSTAAGTAAAKGFAGFVRDGLEVVEKTVGKIPGAKGIVKLVRIPADLGVMIADAIGEAGLFKRAGLEWVRADITIGPLHTYTLTMTDLEVCKDGVWVPSDKKRCTLADGGEVPSTVISHTWSIGGGRGSDLTELTEAGTGFKDKLATAIQAIIDAAIATPAQIDAASADCR